MLCKQRLKVSLHVVNIRGSIDVTVAMIAESVISQHNFKARARVRARVGAVKELPQGKLREEVRTGECLWIQDSHMTHEGVEARWADRAGAIMMIGVGITPDQMGHKGGGPVLMIIVHEVAKQVDHVGDGLQKSHKPPDSHSSSCLGPQEQVRQQVKVWQLTLKRCPASSSYAFSKMVVRA